MYTAVQIKPRNLRNPRLEERHARALEFTEASKPLEAVNYKWLADYAKLLWDEQKKVFATLDDKAESIVRYLSGGTGLFAFGLLAKVSVTNQHIAVCAVPALGCALVAILLAMLTKKPMAFPRLPPVRQAKTYADFYKQEEAAIGSFLGQWNLACEEAEIACEKKARLLGWAMIASYVSLALLLLPIAVALLIPPVS